jgi:hypothetical protein
MKTHYRALALALLVASAPAFGAWEELRRNDKVRLSIDPASIKSKGGEVSFRYLVDFREMQGDVKTAMFRSLVTRAVVRCQARTISARGTEGFAGNEGQGPSVGVLEAAPADKKFKKLEKDSSDEDLWKRVCAKPAAAAAAPAASAKK